MSPFRRHDMNFRHHLQAEARGEDQGDAQAQHHIRTWHHRCWDSGEILPDAQVLQEVRQHALIHNKKLPD